MFSLSLLTLANLRCVVIKEKRRGRRPTLAICCSVVRGWSEERTELIFSGSFLAAAGTLFFTINNFAAAAAAAFAGVINYPALAGKSSLLSIKFQRGEERKKEIEYSVFCTHTHTETLY